MSKLTLDRILLTQGFGTRKGCRELIATGQISIAGSVFDDFNTPIETDGLEFSFENTLWTYREHVYVMLNKPSHFECSRKPSHHPGVLSLLPDQFTRRDVQPVGRLDHDTTGMLLMSDDGAFIHRLSSPKYHIPKVYVATTHDPVTMELIELLLKGVKLHDEPALIAAQTCRQLNSNQLEIVLKQGKYHQVKRMLAAAGNHCTALNRSQIGQLKLADLNLAQGAWCYLDATQLASLNE
jgi:16S rRNA pseudouridine516 synthase